MDRLTHSQDANTAQNDGVVRDWIFINKSMKTIAETVARDHGITVADLRGPSKERRIAWPRQEAIALMVRAGKTQSEAARFFGRTYWTAYFAIAAVESRRALAQQEAA